jgi:hypothetical protein
MMNRSICPAEEKLSEYLSGVLHKEEKDELEEHLVSCEKCRKLIVEADEIINSSVLKKIGEKVMKRIKDSRWFIGALAAFIFSFLLPRYFLQFLIACMLMGAKWIMDSKTTKMLVMIYEAWKKGDTEIPEKVFSRLNEKGGVYGKKTDC